MTFRERLREGERLLGTVLSVRDPALAELAAAPLDFVWIDLEHGALDVGDLHALLPAVRASQAATLVRLPHASSERLPAILDAGVEGVVAPRVESAQEAEELVRRMRYPPEGSRGFGPRRAGSYGRTPAFWRSSEADVAVVVQIESRAGVEASAALASVDGVDALVLGATDLSFDLGSPHELDAPALHVAAEAVSRAASEHGKAYGVAAGSPAAVAKLMGGGGSVGVVSVDVRLYAAAIDAVADELHTFLGRPLASREGE